MVKTFLKYAHMIFLKKSIEPNGIIKVIITNHYSFGLGNYVHRKNPPRNNHHFSNVMALGRQEWFTNESCEPRNAVAM